MSADAPAEGAFVESGARPRGERGEGPAVDPGGGPSDERGGGPGRGGRGAGDPSAFGTPLEVPWWVIPLGLPPLITLVLGTAVPAPLSGRLLDLVASAAMIWVLVRVGTRVRSPSMQSVWISAAYAFWLFIVLLWAVEAVG